MRTTRFILDPAGRSICDETTVDVVTVPCPGGDALHSWSRNGLASGHYGVPSMCDVKVNERARMGSSWVRQGIRREANRARILLYGYPKVIEGTTFGQLADELLEDLDILRRQEDQERPVLFVAHSVGGVVVKMALIKASQNPNYEGIWRNCYGIAFFGTPHQGSGYFAMPSLAFSIQRCLQLSSPLPTSLTDDLRVGNSFLLHIQEDFKDISNDFCIWTFYETIDSRLCGSGSGDVYFTAPLTSIKSAILGMRQERIFPLQSDHANIASFESHNIQTLRLFLRQLAFHIGRADTNSRDDRGRTLDLEQKVNIEVHEFFDDRVGPSNPGNTVVRPWSTRLTLKDFLNKGPGKCLEGRLKETEAPPEAAGFLRASERTSLAERGDDRAPFIPLLWPTSMLTRHSTPVRRYSPLIRAGLDQNLAVDNLSLSLRGDPGRSINRSLSDESQFESQGFPPLLLRSRRDIDRGVRDVDGDHIATSSPLPEAMVAICKVVRDDNHKKNESVIMGEISDVSAKPEVNTRKFVWFHLPYNNPAWVKNVLEMLQVEYKRDFSPLYSSDFWAKRHTRGRHAQHYAYFAKPGYYLIAPHILSPRSHSLMRPSISAFPPDDGMYTCLFLPYLHFDSYERLIRRRNLIFRRNCHGWARPIPEDVVESESLELQIIWKFLGIDPPFNYRRTLGQYGYPSLRDTRSKDDNQTLYKLTKEQVYLLEQQKDLSSQGSSSQAGSVGSGNRRKEVTGKDSDQSSDDESHDRVLNGNVLIVDQLWLWTISSHTLLSFFPQREGDPVEGPLYQQADLRDSIFNEVNGDLKRQCENALDLAALAALHAVSVLIDRSSHPDLEVFRAFEEAIGILSERLTSSLKTFRTKGFRDKAFDYESVENKEQSIRARQREEGRQVEQENRDITSALIELRDLEDELLILLHLFEQQSNMISSMHATYSQPEMQDSTVNGRGFLNEALKKLSDYAHKVNKIIQRARNTRDDYDNLLQMMQRQARVDEVRLNRLHADLASVQNRSVMIFAAFTVIFLPLTFFTSLFSMNTKEWRGGGGPSLMTIGVISLPLSVVLIVTALVIAWSTRAPRFLH